MVLPHAAFSVTATPHQPSPHREMSNVTFLSDVQRPARSSVVTGGVWASATPATQNAAKVVAIARGAMTDVIQDLIQVMRPRWPRPTTKVVFALIVFLLATPVALVALALGFGLLPLPYELFLVREKLPWAFPLHMVASGLALILIPIAVFLRHRRSIHRAAGRGAGACVAIGGTTALLVALASGASAAARAGFFTQGLIWLALFVAAVVAIRKGAMLRHVRMMLAMAAVASGAIWLRLTIYAAISAGLPFEPTYAIAAWACWMVPLGVALVAPRRLIEQVAWRAQSAQAHGAVVVVTPAVAAEP